MPRKSTNKQLQVELSPGQHAAWLQLVEKCKPMGFSSGGELLRMILGRECRRFDIAFPDDLPERGKYPRGDA